MVGELDLACHWQIASLDETPSSLVEDGADSWFCDGVDERFGSEIIGTFAAQDRHSIYFGAGSLCVQ